MTAVTAQCDERCDEKSRWVIGNSPPGSWQAHPSAGPLGFARGFGETGHALAKGAMNGAPARLLRYRLDVIYRYIDIAKGGGRGDLIHSERPAEPAR